MKLNLHSFSRRLRVGIAIGVALFASLGGPGAGWGQSSAGTQSVPAPTSPASSARRAVATPPNATPAPRQGKTSVAPKRTASPTRGASPSRGAVGVDTDRAVERIESQLRRLNSEREPKREGREPERAEHEPEARAAFPWADAEASASLEIPRRCAAVALRNSAERLNAVWTFRRADAPDNADADNAAENLWRVPLGYRQTQVIYLEAGFWKATLRVGLPGVGSSTSEVRELRVSRGQTYDSILTPDLEREMRKPLERLKQGRTLPKGVDERFVYPAERR